jgi:cellobiose epimerase
MRIPLHVAAAVLALGCVCAGPPPEDSRPERLRISAEIESALKHGLLEAWYPRCVDAEYGGFLSAFDANWNPVGPQDKAVVNQARHVWTCSMAAARYPQDSRYEAAAIQGFRFLKDKLWDARYGGFYPIVNRRGEFNPASAYGDEKRAYGNAFGLYACAAYYRLTRDPEALALARECFGWLDAHARDPVHLGYFQNLRRDGTPLAAGDTTAGGWDRATAGLKDQNSSIHLLEAFTALYEVWPDSLVRVRLLEMQHLIRDVLVSPAGYLRLFFRPDWTPVSFRDSSETVRSAHFDMDHVSFGHDVETAFLLLEASKAAGLRNDPVTLRTARTMVDHALRTGWDFKHGGLFDRGYYFAGAGTIAIIDDAKVWWVEAEALHSFLMMSRLFPSDRLYGERFRQEWEYIRSNLLDAERGGWYENGIDSRPGAGQGLKGHEWKATYHETRSLMNCLDLLSEGGR